MTTSGGTRGREEPEVNTVLAPEVGARLGEAGANSRGGAVVFFGTQVRSGMRDYFSEKITRTTDYQLLYLSTQIV